jgi:hypothetical protein
MGRRRRAALPMVYDWAERREGPGMARRVKEGEPMGL